MRVFNFYNFVGYQVAWFACVLGAAKDLAVLGASVAVVVTLAHLVLSGHRRAELALIVVAISIGLLVDSGLVSGGHITFHSGVWAQGWAPYWMLSLWAAFATTLNHSLRWLVGKPVIAILFGAAGGPLAYLAGEKLGALQISSTAGALLSIAAAWAVAMGVLSIVAASLQPAAPSYRGQEMPGQRDLSGVGPCGREGTTP
jgi:hypothetical protein